MCVWRAEPDNPIGRTSGSQPSKPLPPRPSSQPNGAGGRPEVLFFFLSSVSSSALVLVHLVGGVGGVGRLSFICGSGFMVLCERVRLFN